MNGLVSVVVPVGRVDDLLQVQLAALSNQRTGRQFEVVLACNSSRPSTRQALDRMVGSIGDPRFRVVASGMRRGAAHARNTGAREASGDTIVFCDADDEVEPGWLGEIVDALVGLDAVGGQLVDVGLSERHAAARPATTPGQLPEFFGVPYLVSANMAITRSAFDLVGGFDEELVRCEDIAISWRLIAAGAHIGFAPTARVAYRHRSGVRSMMAQHFAYGRGMGQLLVSYGIPSEDGWVRPSGLTLLRPNPRVPTASRGRPTLLSTLRRGSLAAGRAVGLLEGRGRRVPHDGDAAR